MSTPGKRVIASLREMIRDVETGRPVRQSVWRRVDGKLVRSALTAPLTTRRSHARSHMAKKKKKAGPNASGYDRITATVSDGRVTFQYRVTGLTRDGRDGYDGDVSDWTDDQIKELGCDLLGVDRRFVNEVVVHWD